MKNRPQKVIGKNKYRIFVSLLFVLTVYVWKDMTSLERSYLSDFVENIKKLPHNLLWKLSEANKIPPEEFRQMAFSYLKNVTKIHNGNYLELLNNTLTTFNISPKAGINNFETSWPTLIPDGLRIPFTKELNWNGFPLPVMTGKPHGRLGNVMGEYATLFALGRLYNVTVFLHPEMKEKLKAGFPYITMKSVPDGNSTTNKEWITLHKQENHSNYSPLEVAAAGLMGPRLFIFEDWPFEIQLFNSIRREILEEFRFSHRLINKATSFLHGVEESVRKANATASITYIGFHVRRTDYVKYILNFGENLPGETFFQRALQHYRQKFKFPIFVAASEDRKFLNNTFNDSDIYIVPGLSPESDMTILSLCNHSIFTVGSYGFWGAYLADGEVVYPDLHPQTPYVFSRTFYAAANLTNFIPISIH